MRVNKQLGILGAAIVLAAGIGTAVALSGADGDGKSSKAAGPVPAWCLDSPTDYHSPNHGGCVIIAGCQHIHKIFDLDDILAKENPIGSSGYRGDTDVAAVLKQIRDLTTEELNTPNIPPPIKRARESDIGHLTRAITLYEEKGDWTRANLDRTLDMKGGAMACLNLTADLHNPAASPNAFK
ncbi:hypothetical protein [Embleya sp. NPDC005575]|uniref:hypothetical protein n=1 Tax=Embleya sp. NPDC005575 TaxID=3156892 RepID=UPI0033A9957C